VESQRWARLGARITEHRSRLGYSRAQFAAVSGLSRATLDNLEHARKASYDPTTLATLEHALGWKQGSVARVLSGLEPQPVTDPYLQAVHTAWPRLSPREQRVLAILATEMARDDT
jgi:transcriptional regulator with XRE-family HTH domain